MQTGPAGVVKNADEIQPKREASEFQEEICHQQAEYTTSANRAAFNDSTTRFAESRPDSRLPGKCFSVPPSFSTLFFT